MIRITIEIDERRQDDSFAERLRHGVERDQRILRRLDDAPPFQIPIRFA